MLAAYSKLAKVKIAKSTAEGTCSAVYARWHKWALAEVAADRLGKRTLGAADALKAA